jgi:geranylgeranyl diphosphate synthase type I
MDDYIDNSKSRRGGPCAHILHGFPIANTASCTGFSLSHYIFNNNELNLPTEKLAKLLNAVAQEHIHMAFGQIEELYWTESNVNTVTVDEYLQETIARCAFLSFRGPLRYAGVIADAPEEDIPILESIGEFILIGYHIKGDSLGLAPNSEDWGKTAGEDITTGRRTLLIIHALEKANEKEREDLIDILNSRTEDEERLKEVHDLLVKYDAFDFASELAQDYNERTKRKIEQLSISDEYKMLFNEFADFAALKRSV